MLGWLLGGAAAAATSPTLRAKVFIPAHPFAEAIAGSLDDACRSFQDCGLTLEEFKCELPGSLRENGITHFRFDAHKDDGKWLVPRFYFNLYAFESTWSKTWHFQGYAVTGGAIITKIK